MCTEIDGNIDYIIAEECPADIYLALSIIKYPVDDLVSICTHILYTNPSLLLSFLFFVGNVCV